MTVRSGESPTQRSADAAGGECLAQLIGVAERQHDERDDPRAQRRAGTPGALRLAHLGGQSREDRDRRDRHCQEERGALGIHPDPAHGTEAALESVEHVVDINPRKHGRHVPGTGQRVVAPGALTTAPPDEVVVLNPLYVAEVQVQLAALGVTATVRSPSTAPVVSR